MSKDTEWMYTGSSKPDAEQYLLGRRIDDAIDPTQDTNDPSDWISGKVPEDGDIGARAEMWKTRDAFAKAREDPMFIIEKQKRNAHVDFKNNPLKMQKIRDLLASELKKDLKKRKKRRKSMEEETKPERSSESRQKHRQSPERSSSSGRAAHEQSSSRSRAANRSRSRSPVYQKNRRSRSRDKRDRSHDRRNRSPEKTRKRKSRSRSPEAGKERKSLQKPASYKQAKPKPAVARGGSGISKKMTAEELERKRAEMMSNASNRDTERKEKYTRRKDTELADTAANKEGKAEFLHKFKVDSYSSSSTSVEERIKSGIFSKQRTKADLNTFLKK